MAKPEKFVFVCNNNRPKGHPRGSCRSLGSAEVLAKFDESFQTNSLYGKVSLVETGCMGPCSKGTIVAIFPDNCWYKDVTAEDVEDIVKSHLIGGEVVERLHFKDSDWD